MEIHWHWRMLILNGVTSAGSGFTPIRNTETGNVAEWPEPGTGRVSRTLTIDRNGFKSQWNRLRIVKRGVGDIRLTRPIPERTLSFSSA